MKNEILPNAYIIGVQKAGTTTLHDWLIQHPDVYGKAELKDVDFFAHPERSKNSKALLSSSFKKHRDEKIILQSCVNYFLYEEALRGISELTPQAKLIVILRNPVARAFSAYNYFKKLQVEKRNIEEALLYTPQGNLKFSRFNNDFTYIEHGLYYQQLKQCLKYFNEKQLLVLEFDDLRNSPGELLSEVYEFLGISKDFEPSLKASNITGEVKHKWIQDMLLNSGSIKKGMMRFLDIVGLTPHKRKLIKQRLVDINTQEKKERTPLAKNIDINHDKIKEELKRVFREDSKKLDLLLGTQFELKWFK